MGLRERDDFPLESRRQLASSPQKLRLRRAQVLQGVALCIPALHATIELPYRRALVKAFEIVKGPEGYGGGDP